MPALPVDTRLFEWYVRLTFYGFLVLWPLFGFMLASNFAPDLAEFGVLSVVGIAQCGLTVWVGHRAVNLLRRRSGEGSLANGWPWRAAPELSWLAVTVVNVAVIVAWGSRHGLWPGLVLTALIACSAGTITPVLSPRQTVGVYGVTALIVLACMLGNGLSPERIFSAVAVAVLATFYLCSLWLTVWILRVMGELEHSRDVAGRLAVAEDRLRISRDLHDVFGRTLATISVKSTLAAELSRRGQGERAAAEMEQIRQIADGAGSETRQVVQGRRDVDLASELEGARSVLASAGVACEVAADTRWIHPQVAERLAWVTREAVTNILRHSKASAVWIELSSANPITLRITNDHPLEGTTGTGNGLLGMAARVSEVGGQLTSRAVDDSFELLAVIPNRHAAGTVPERAEPRRTVAPAQAVAR